MALVGAGIYAATHAHSIAQFFHEFVMVAGIAMAVIVPLTIIGVALAIRRSSKPVARVSYCNDCNTASAVALKQHAIVTNVRPLAAIEGKPMTWDEYITTQQRNQESK